MAGTEKNIDISGNKNALCSLTRVEDFFCCFEARA
nr:MAG TPA: hypothetical protein [Caudoviricetes sp.]